MNQKRIVAGIFDFLITAVIQAILVFLLIIKPLMESQTENQFVDVSSVFIKMMFVTFISMLYLIIRDNLGKKSIGKRVIGLAILDIKSNAQVGFARRLLRNLTWILGPIEIIFLLITGYRIGDKISNTKVEIIKR